MTVFERIVPKTIHKSTHKKSEARKQSLTACVYFVVFDHMVIEILRGLETLK